MNQKEVWLQVSAGQGPVECAWAVAQVAARLAAEAATAGLSCHVLEVTPGVQAGTAQSVLLAVRAPDAMEDGEVLPRFHRSWVGTVLWVARSPFRPTHKRKNWFVGVEALEPVDATTFVVSDLRWETMRASGPGGQHVNRTESAVRVTHVATGLQASASEERSQHRNRSLALARLRQKLEARNLSEQDLSRDSRWRAHYRLERGNPVRVLEG